MKDSEEGRKELAYQRRITKKAERERKKAERERKAANRLRKQILQRKNQEYEEILTREQSEMFAAARRGQGVPEGAELQRRRGIQGQ